MPTTAKAPVIKIDKNIPLPKYTKMPVRDNLVEDLKKMKPLESRIIDIDFSKETLNAVRTRIDTIKKSNEMEDRRFTVNLDPVTEKKLRVWRVE